MQGGHDRRPALLGSFFLIILLSYLLPLIVCLILQVFDETCSNVLHSLLGIAPIRFSSWETRVGERESKSKVKGKEKERL